HDVLRELVGGDRRETDRDQAEPLERPRAERPFGDRDGRERFDVPQGSAHPRSASRLQSMQSDAQGYASRRSGAISPPQRVHVPYVPFSMRSRDASIATSMRLEFSSSV